MKSHLGRPLAVLLVALASLAAVSSPAWAHAILLQATPAPNAAVAGPELKVELKFNSRIDARRSRVTVLMPDKSARVLTTDTSASPDTLLARGQGFAACCCAARCSSCRRSRWAAWPSRCSSCVPGEPRRGRRRRPFGD
ncbi:MAG TPA: copper resistance protein CopC [Vicinamibacteria bacterium]|nr:copper resistance protein CopC [Vicinamibacteria bacterium]